MSVLRLLCESATQTRRCCHPSNLSTWFFRWIKTQTHFHKGLFVSSWIPWASVVHASFFCTTDRSYSWTQTLENDKLLNSYQWWFLTFWLSHFISPPLSVERQEAEPAGVKLNRRRRLPSDSGGVEMTNLVTYSKRCLRQSTNYWGKTLVFLMIADGTGRCQQTPELNKYQPRSTSGFLCSVSCLKTSFHWCSNRRKGFFFYMWGVYACFLFLFYNVTNGVDSEKYLVWLGNEMHKCTVLLKSEIKSNVSECLMRIMSILSVLFLFFFVFFFTLGFFLSR